MPLWIILGNIRLQITVFSWYRNRIFGIFIKTIFNRYSRHIILPDSICQIIAQILGSIRILHHMKNHINFSIMQCFLHILL